MKKYNKFGFSNFEYHNAWNANGVCVLTAEMERLYALASPAEYEAGIALFRRGAVSQADAPNDTLLFWVAETRERQQVALSAVAVTGGRCGCAAYTGERRPCRHIVAAMLYAEDGGLLAGARHRRAREAGFALLGAMEARTSLETRLRLDALLQCRRDPQGRPSLAVALRVGVERLYAVRDIRRFLREIGTKEPMVFGKGFTLHPEWMRSEPADERLLEALREAAQAVHEPGNERWLELTPASAARVLRLLMARQFRIAVSDHIHVQERIWPGALPVRMTVRGAGQELHITAELPPSARALVPDAEFVFSEGNVLRIPREQRPLLGVLFGCAQQGRADLRFAARESARVVSELLPQLYRAGEVRLDAGIARRVVRKPLEAAVYLDREGRGIVARVSFQYGEHSIDPFAPATAGEAAPRDEQGLLLMRDAQGEQRVLDILATAGFRVQRERVRLSDPEGLARFFSQGMQALQGAAQVYLSTEFRRMSPRRPSLAGMLKLCEGGLRLEITEEGMPVEELLPLMEALRANRRYFMLRDGAVLDLSAMEEWLPLAEALHEAASGSLPAEASAAGSGVMELASCRAAYLTELVAETGLPIAVEEGVRRMMEAVSHPPDCAAPLEGILRPYQQRGFAWLRALQSAGMGGILADDMGLGKTVQLIALTLWLKQKQPKQVPMLVVAPSSLVYNWQAEIQQYAPELSALVLEGSQAARTARLRALRAEPDVDVLITSYPLLRRDIAALEELRFCAVALDEAQYVKNPASIAAAAAKRLRADARFALTGTPMENHPGELWSLFEFTLPGYLGPLARFMHRHGAGQNAEELRKKTAPFLLRRLKRDVLTDLPAKLETRLLAEMSPEQRRVYQAALLRLSREVDSLLAQNGLRRGRMEALAVLTELRQICCHPALCLPDYSASSGKLDALMDVLPGALEAGHRVLIFSQFTSMLRILRRHLEASEIVCLYLDGDTPGKERIQLVRRFNGGEGQVFLISLRAGGSGLNLTGADMVVHYDPWWNPAAEDQATDRAHRIGQTRAVQVIRLITRHSVEEQVSLLGERKRALFDAIVDGGEDALTQTSEEELRALLSGIAKEAVERQ